MEHGISLTLLKEEFKECLNTHTRPIFFWQVSGDDLIFFDVCHDPILTFTPCHTRLSDCELGIIKSHVFEMLTDLEEEGYLILDHLSVPEEEIDCSVGLDYMEWVQYEDDWDGCTSDWTDQLQDFVF